MYKLFIFHSGNIGSIKKSIEQESYFKAVNRETSEELLQKRVDGSCLIRPFKEIVILFKYHY